MPPRLREQKKVRLLFGDSWFWRGRRRGFQQIERWRVGIEHERGVLINDFLERFEFPQKTIKIGLFLMRRGINVRDFRFRFTARLLGGFTRFGKKNRFLRVRFRVDRVRFLFAFRAVALGKLRTFGAHSLENETRVHFRQRDPLDADLFDGDAERIFRLTGS